jgi:hypothetical protein
MWGGFSHSLAPFERAFLGSPAVRTSLGATRPGIRIHRARLYGPAFLTIPPQRVRRRLGFSSQEIPCACFSPRNTVCWH